MADPTLPNGDLALLTDALDDPGTDLHDALTAFADNLATVVPSFLGMTTTLILDGVAVTLSVHDPDLAVTSNACLGLPFSALVPAMTDSTMMFYAAEAGAFTDLAAVVTRSAGAIGHPPHPRKRRLAALRAFASASGERPCRILRPQPGNRSAHRPGLHR